MRKTSKETNAFAIFMDDFYSVFSTKDFDENGNCTCKEIESFNINDIETEKIVEFKSVEDAERFADFENMGFTF